MFPKAVTLVLVSLFWASLSASPQTPPSTKDQAEQHARLAQQYLRQQRPDLAIPELKKVVALDPGNVEARGNLGVLLFFSREYKDAVPELRAAVQAKPELWKIQALLGMAEAQLHDDSASRSDMQAAFPHLSDAKFQLDVGRALIDNYTATGDLDEAATTVSALLASHPTDTSLLYLSYRLYSDLAGRSMLTLALTAPASAEMHQVMARELARHGDNDAAIQNYREAIQINPRLPGLHSELGDLLYHSQDEKLKAQAEAEFKAAVAVDPADEKSVFTLGQIAEQNSDVKGAYADESRAVELAPNDTDACTELAKVLVLMNRQDEAQKMLERAIQIDPTNYAAHYRLAGLYRQHGRMDDAKQQVAEYRKYKDMKDKLQKIFEDMRVTSGPKPASDDDGPM
jgi:cytochrome c-type biogenesis protein CcmH/NrfG